MYTQSSDKWTWEWEIIIPGVTNRSGLAKIIASLLSNSNRVNGSKKA